MNSIRPRRDGPELVAEEELFELFARRRPDAARFRAGVEERIAVRERALAARSVGRREAPRRVARMATALWRVVVDSLAPMPASGRDTADGPRAIPEPVKLGFARGLSLVLTLPVLLLAAAFGALASGARSLVGSTRGATQEERALYRPGMPLNAELAWSQVLKQAIGLGFLAVLGTMTLYGGSRALDVLTLLSVTSMAALVVNVRGLARAGALTRERVSQACVGLMFTLYLACYYSLLEFSGHIADPAFEGTPALVVLWFGALLCVLVDAFVWRTAWRAGVAFILLCLFHPFGSTYSSAASIRAQLEGFELTAESPTGLEWQKAAALFSALQSIGEEPPELPELAAEVARAIDARVEAPDDVWVAAERMGLIRDEDRKLLVAQRLGGTFDGLGWVGELELGPTFWFSESALAFVLMAPRLTGEARALAAERLDPCWPAADERDALRRAAYCLYGLEQLGAEERVHARRADAWRLLEALWVPAEGEGLFDRGPGFAYRREDSISPFPWTNWNAVELMSRFGIPDGIDASRLRARLRQDARSSWPLTGSEPSRESWARASLLWLDHTLEPAPRTPLERLLDDRLLLGSLALLVLCLVAVRLAPPARPVRGTLP